MDNQSLISIDEYHDAKTSFSSNSEKLAGTPKVDQTSDDNKFRSGFSFGAPGQVLLDIVDEDEWRQDVLNPCTKEREVEVKPKFDYYRFMEFHRLRGLKAAIEKSTETRKGHGRGLELKEDTKYFYQKQFEQMYGPVNFSPDHMLPKLKAMVETMSQLITAPLSESDIMDQLADEGIINTDREACMQMLKDKIDILFPIEEQKKYGNLDPSKSEGDWFIIPRQKLKTIRQDKFAEIKYEEETKDTKYIAQTSSGKSAGFPSHHSRTSNNDLALEDDLQFSSRKIDVVEKKCSQNNDVEDTKPHADSENGRVKTASLEGSKSTKSGSIYSELKSDSKNEEHEDELRETTPKFGEHCQTPDYGWVYCSGSREEEPSVAEKVPMYTCSALKNLHVYDPKFELCFSIPYRIFSTLGGNDNRAIPRKLSCSILELLNSFPNGIAPKSFWETFYKKYNYLPKLNNLTYYKLLEYHTEEVYFEENPPLPRLVFPSFLHGITSPELILNRVWHAIMCLLGRRPAIPVNEIFPSIERLYGFRFDPSNWGFDKVRTFLEICLDYFRVQGCFIVHRVNYVVNRVASHSDWFMVDSMALREKIAAIFNVPAENELRPVDIIIPKDCMGVGEMIDCISNHIEMYETHLMQLVSLKDPHRMGLVPASYVPKLRVFQYELQNMPMSLHVINQKRINPSIFQPGLYVLVHIYWGSEPLQWYRARIVVNKKAEKAVYVYSIDFGFLKDVSYDKVRLMPKDQIAEEMAYAVPVKLAVFHPFKKPKKGKISWEYRESCDIMFDIVGENPMKVNFLACKYNEALGCAKWQITSSVIETNSNEIIHESLSSSFFKRFRTAILARREMRKEKMKAAKSRKATPVVQDTIEEEIEDSKNADIMDTFKCSAPKEGEYVSYEEVHIKEPEISDGSMACQADEVLSDPESKEAKNEKKMNSGGDGL